MPRHDQHVVALEPAAKDVGVWKNGAEHQRPGDDALPIHRATGEHVVAPENGFADQCARDAVSDCVHLLGERGF